MAKYNLSDFRPLIKPVFVLSVREFLDSLDNSDIVSESYYSTKGFKQLSYEYGSTFRAADIERLFVFCTASGFHFDIHFDCDDYKNHITLTFTAYVSSSSSR